MRLGVVRIDLERLEQGLEGTGCVALPLKSNAELVLLHRSISVLRRNSTAHATCNPHHGAHGAKNAGGSQTSERPRGALREHGRIVYRGRGVTVNSKAFLHD